MKLVQESPYRFRIDAHDGMRVPGIVFASRELLPADGADMALKQVVNVAKLPGIVDASYAMPDVCSICTGPAAKQSLPTSNRRSRWNS